MQMHSITEWERRLMCSRRKIEQMVASGELPTPIRIGRLRRWSDAQIDQYIQSRVEAAGGDGQPRGPGRPRAGTEGGGL